MGAETVSESVVNRLRNGKIHLALRSSVFKDSSDALNLDVWSVMGNLGIFQSVLTGCQSLREDSELEAFYCFLLIRKLSKMHESVSRIESWSRSQLLNVITGISCQAYD